MTNLHTCTNCSGVYMDPQADGTRYFHACPDVANPDYQPDIRAAKYDPRATVPMPGARDENILPGLACDNGQCFTVSRDVNDPAIMRRERIDVLEKKPGAGRAPFKTGG